MNYYIANYKRFRTLCSNYPKWLIGKIDHAYKVYDGIRSEADFEAFAESLASDPTGRRFLDGNGEVVLHCDLTLNGFVPLSNFRARSTETVRRSRSVIAATRSRSVCSNVSAARYGT